MRAEALRYPEFPSDKALLPVRVPSRLVDEPAKDYKIFATWVREGRHTTMAWLARRAGISRGQMSKLARRFQWRARLEALGADGPEFRDRQARINHLLDTEYQKHRELIQLADEAIEKWRGSDRPPTLVEIARLVELASRLGRLSLGMPLDRTEVEVESENKVNLDFQAALLRVYGEPSETEKDEGMV
jgi:hypothetical protein